MVNEGLINSSIEYNKAKEGTATNKRVALGIRVQAISNAVLWLKVSTGFVCDCIDDENPTSIEAIIYKTKKTIKTNKNITS